MSARLNWLFAVAALALIGVLLGLRRADAGTRLVFLSVGQGDCTVFQSNGQTLLIDVGPKSEDFDAGRRIVLPKLRRLGIGNVDLIVLTHPDSDHIGGLTAVFNRYPNATVVISSAFREHPDMRAALLEAQVPDRQILWLAGRSTAQVGDFTLDLVAPPMAADEKDNDGSIFARLSNGQAAMVATGDAPIEVENRMERILHWTAQIMKAGHHGSRTSSGVSWIREVSPTWAIISCGRDNRFGHPHKSVLEAYSRFGVRVLRTDEQGDIAFHVQSGFFEPDA